MAIDHKIIRNSENFRGLDKRSSDIMRSREFASHVKNAAYRVTGAINKRKGFKKICETGETCFGLTTYKDIDPTTGVLTDSLIGAGLTNLIKYEKINLVLTYSGSNENMTVECKLDTTTKTFKFDISDEGTSIFNYDLGTGEETVPTNLTTLAAAMPTDFSLNVGTAGSNAAAFISNLATTSIGASSTLNLEYHKRDLIDKGDTAATLFTHEHLATEAFQNVSFEQLNNVLYISNGKDEVLKYDGEHVYRAGLPIFPEDSDAADYFDPANNLSSDASGVALTNGYYSYKLVLEYTDKKGNVITSQPSNAAEIEVTGGSHHVHITFDDYVSSHLDGFDKAATFDSTHPLFSSLNTGSRPAASMTGKWQNEKRLRVLIYRAYDTSSVAADAIYHLIGDVPYDYDNTGHSGITGAAEFADHDTDTELNLFLALPDPIKRHDPPPKGSYLTKFKECLVIAGQPSSVNNVSYSLGYNAKTLEIGSEYFPSDDNQTIVNSSFGTKITAVAALRDLLYIFHEDSIHVLAGDISNPEGIPYTVDLLTNEGGLGCTSHHSITEFKNSLVFLSKQGYFSINASNALQELSSIIKPIFKDKDLVFDKAVTFNWTEKDVLMMIIPKEVTKYFSLSGKTFSYTSQTDSLIVVYDYFREAWLQWNNIDFSAGIDIYQGELAFLPRNVDDATSILHRMNDLDDSSDYADHTEAIDFEYDTNWESLGEPTVPKKFLRLKIHSFDTEGNFESPAFSLDMKIQKDYNDIDLGNIQFDFGGSNGESGWGASSWGDASWGAVPRKFVKTKLPTGKSKCTKLRFTNNSLHENVLITNYEFEIATPYRTEIKD
jgi:hypothetical protein